MKRTVQTAVLAGMMAFGLAACNTPSNTDSMSGSSTTSSTMSSAESSSTQGMSGGGQVPEAGKGQSWTAGSTGATGVNGAAGTQSNDGVTSSGDRR